uniref:Protein-serine/threonine phosphatase n=2 Tax=Macrostomum lignano TaxID=282301 RepID=A0A1I8IW53_9PLAT
MIQHKVGRQNDRVVFAESLSRGLQIVVDMPCNKVLDRLYVGSIETLTPYYLTLYNIRQIVSVSDCGEGYEELVHTTMHNPATGEDLPLLQYYVGDLTKSQISMHFDSCALFTHHGRVHDKNVLVHCNQGVSRSPAIVTAYLMCLADDMELVEILQALKVMRSKININTAFISQLLDFKTKWARKVWSNIKYELGDWWKVGLDRSRLERYSKRFVERGLQLQEMPEIQRCQNQDE